jgi:hypothetical protein
MFDRLFDTVNKWLESQGIDPVVFLTVVFLIILIQAIRDLRANRSGFMHDWSVTAIWGASLVILFGLLYILGIIPKKTHEGMHPSDTIVTTQEPRGISYDTSYWRTAWRDSSSIPYDSSRIDTLNRHTR